MPLFAFSLAIFAAILHAIWNFFAKKTAGNMAVLFLGLWLAALLPLPVILCELAYQPQLLKDLAANYYYILGTGITHALYFFTLFKAYHLGDISVVYPIARGVGITGTSLIAYFFLQEEISLIGGIGIFSICTGTLMFSLKNSRRGNSIQAIIVAFLVGLTIIGYSVIDKLAVQQTNPIWYIFSMYLATALLMTPYFLLKYRHELKSAWQQYKKYSIIIGCGSMGTYLIILFAFRLAQVSYIVATRELAVVFGALLGVKFLHEKLTLHKTICILFITLGLILIKLA